MRRGIDLRQTSHAKESSHAKEPGPAAVRHGRARLALTLAAMALASGLVVGCSGQTIKHGHQFHENDVQQVQPGMSVDQVKLVLGTPATTATVNKGAAFYYISSTATQVAFLSPKEVDRQVLAVYFTPAGTVERVANYGLKDGKVFDYVKRTTPARGVQDEDLLKQLFRNLGKKQLFGD